MITIDINSSSRYPVNRKRIQKLIEKILGREGLEKEVEVSILFCGDRKMTELNQSYLKRQGTTDVLAFPLKGDNFPDDILRLGDIIISYPQARRQAGLYNHLVDEEIDRLVRHGLLNLLGLGEAKKLSL